MQCRCDEIAQCRRDSEKLMEAVRKMSRADTANGIVSFQSGKMISGVNDAYDSGKKSYAGEILNRKKEILNRKVENTIERIQAKRSELAGKIQCMEKEDEQFHIEEARRKREEERRRELEESKKSDEIKGN